MLLDNLADKIIHRRNPVFAVADNEVLGDLSSEST